MKVFLMYHDARFVQLNGSMKEVSYRYTFNRLTKLTAFTSLVVKVGFFVTACTDSVDVDSFDVGISFCRDDLKKSMIGLTPAG
jgi:hypothetical protein